MKPRKGEIANIQKIVFNLNMDSVSISMGNLGGRNILNT
jgi:hypothetical protein